ncbi:DNA replication and repair protein RecN [Rubritalea squalenifaciens DSM 18772]|uniref:DNA repair protein RecN n=1 Tax=Rubritalea squalenifaciens DSM 18772 TaxID=1123071 RepID=A0A1M6I3A0_9BACT|nr:DNA repair protein RecN [Rubritalea squalenifaciens]SHJ28906.1 DNA replication and repair protein RecN [Rubritalea squalenifaciens DSM 18772]
MLTLLNIKNLALVDHLSWQLGKGLIGVTGETGAGKSVIVGALKLVLGERGDKGMIRTGESSCSVEAVFDLENSKQINRLLEQAGVEACEGDQLIVRRVMGQSSNKQFVNNSPVTLSVLKSLGEYLVDLHGPHDHQSLFCIDRQLAMLDAYAAADKELSAYRDVWKAWKAKHNEYEALRKQEQAGEQELDLLRFQVEEIERAELKPEEESDIEERYQRASNSTRLVELATQTAGVLEQGVNESLSDVQRMARELERLDPAIRSLFEGLDSAIVELQELERGLVDYVEDLDVDGNEAQALEDRINTFETLKRKYGPSLEDVVVHGAKIRSKLDSYENRGELLDSLESEVKRKLEELKNLGLKLSDKRRKQAPKLSKEIASHLKELGFKQASFEVRLEAHASPDKGGLESVDFHFGPNPGEPLKPLRQIASSGEISRVMLAVKSALADQDATPLMVFDEIDANVGGEIARAVGEKMAALGERHQVIAITHFPQVAAVAAEHFVVDKQVEKGRTRSTMKKVDGDARVDELVRMLGGGDGERARAMADSLLAAKP